MQKLEEEKGKEPDLMKNKKFRKLQYFEHMVRDEKYQLL